MLNRASRNNIVQGSRNYEEHSQGRGEGRGNNTVTEVRRNGMSYYDYGDNHEVSEQ